MFCISGQAASGAFNQRLHDAVVFCATQGLSPVVNWKEFSESQPSLAASLGASRRKPVPFQGKCPYDYLLWIHPDLVFKPSHILDLIARDRDIVSAANVLGDDQHISAVAKMRPVDMIRGASCFIPLEKIQTTGELIEVEFAGFDFLLIRRGVFEALEQPWFNTAGGPGILTLTSAEVGFCRNARKQGYKIYVDPAVRVHKERRNIF